MIGKLFLRYTPWWAFLPILAIMVPLSISTAEDHLALRAGLDAAKKAPAPVVQRVADLKLDSPRDGAVEVAVLGHFKGKVGEIEAGKVDFAYALLESLEGDGTSVALVSEWYLFDLLLERVEAAKVEDGASLIRGFEEVDHRFRREIQTQLRDSGQTGTVYIVEPYWGTRADALDARLGSNLLLVVISVGFTLIFVVVCGTKLVGWLRRVRAKQNKVRLTLTDTEQREDSRIQTAKKDSATVVRRRR